MHNRQIDNFKSWIAKVEHILVWLIGAWFAHSLIKNGIFKLDSDGFWTNAFENWGFPAWFRVFIGVLEIVGGILVLIPKTRFYGGILLCVIMLGALTTRLINGTAYEDAIYLAFSAIAFLFLAGYRKR